MEIVSRYREAIAHALDEALAVEGSLGVLVRYPVGLADPDGGPGPGVGGKLLRPSLTCFSCEALGGEVERALPLAAAVELVHNFSLVHDDIQDGDELRRGRPAAWKAFGLPQAINAGDALLVLAVRMAGRAALPAEDVLAAVDAILAATFAMIEGQALDVGFEGRPLGVEAYLDMARRKTGALFGCALELGAIAAGRPDLREGHRRLGEVLGLAFQVQDDWLGLWGTPERAGKPVGGDLARGKRSYPIAWALARDPSLAAFLAKGAIREAHRRLTALGAEEATRAAAAGFLAEARAAVQDLPWPDWAHQAFAALAATLAAREA